MMIFIQQDSDPHHMHSDPNLIYYFLILAVIVSAVVFFAGWKLMTYLDDRYERRKPITEDFDPAKEGLKETAESNRDENQQG